MGNLFQELKRRKVYKIATVYVVVSWLLLQVADTLFPAYELPGIGPTGSGRDHQVRW